LVGFVLRFARMREQTALLSLGIGQRSFLFPAGKRSELVPRPKACDGKPRVAGDSGIPHKTQKTITRLGIFYDSRELLFCPFGYRIK